MLKIYGLILLVFLFVSLRIFNLPTSLNYSADQGLILAETYKIYKEKRITLIGPPSSLRNKIQHEFYYGPLTYYLLLPAVIFNKEPLSASYFLIFLNAIGLVLLYQAVSKKFGLKTAFFAGLFFTTYPSLVTYTRFVWNPNFLPLFVSVVLFLMVSISAKKKWFYFLTLGLFSGFCLQLHYQSILLIIFIIGWFIIKKVKILNWLSTFLGFILGFSPIIIFELRHNFYNSKTIFLLLKDGTDKIINSFDFYYLLVLVPFLAILFGIFFNKILNINKIFGGFLILIYLSWVTKEIYGFTLQAPGMPRGWNYLGQKKAINLILAEDKKNYNIANLLSGDTRAQDLRYWLEREGKTPLDILSYPQADWLFVLSRYNEERTLRDPVWEISSFQPAKIAKAWPIQNDISLFLLEKIR